MIDIAGAAPTAQMTLFDAIARGRDLYGARPALGGAETVRTYAALSERIDRLAGVLIDKGVRSADRVALLSTNSPTVVEVLLAAARIGACVVPLNPRLVGAEVAFQIEDAHVRLALIQDSLKGLAADAGLLDRTHVFLGDELDAVLTGVEPYAGPPADVSADLIHLYTSGTTGRPKGCLLSQRNWLFAATSFAHAYSITADDVVLTALPLFHVASLSWTLSTLLVGGTVVIPESTRVDDFWPTVVRHRVTVVAAPFQVRPALNHPSAQTDGATLRMMVGAPSRLVTTLLPDVEMVTGYGATELCGQVTAIRGADFRAHPDSIGRLMAGYAAMIVDANGRPVAAGDTGELLVRGSSLTAGYWRLPDATAELLNGGWLHTGDLVRCDEDGYIYFVDRAKDMIKTGGENVYSAEVEAVLLAHPQVQEVAVFGVPDERWGQAVKAVVVSASPVTAADLDSWCLTRLAPYKRPRWYESAQRLPRNATGKVVKVQLRDAHDASTATRLSER